MPAGAQALRNRTFRKFRVRHCSGWVLCALLLLFCGSARLARYSGASRNLKLATTQSYLDSDETRLEMSIAVLLLLWTVSVNSALRLAATRGSFAVAAVPYSSRHEGEFDPESYLRPPPLR
jgi:hypothetical protein